MSNLQAIADRVEIEALRGEFTDAGTMRDYDRFASLFTPDGAWRMPLSTWSSSAGTHSRSPSQTGCRRPSTSNEIRCLHR